MEVTSLALSSAGIWKVILDGAAFTAVPIEPAVSPALFRSMDCGRRSDAWEEILIQLLDGEADSTRGFMTTFKFAGIVSDTLKTTVEKSKPFLFFEFSPNNGPLQKLRIKSVECDERELSIHLASEVAICKPLFRWGEIGAVVNKVSMSLSRKGCCSGPPLCCG